MTFAYRYVDHGTSFVHCAGARDADALDCNDQARLFENEIAVDVGGVDPALPGGALNVVDHHVFATDGAVPSAACAVLHRAALLGRRFAERGDETVWIVTHREPDFDAFAAMYLVRWLLAEKPDADWEHLGIAPDGWHDVCLGGDAVRRVRRFDWLGAWAIDAPPAIRWALALARYAAHVDNGRHIFVGRECALHSVLYAAIHRGRGYWLRGSGALELFDEARRTIEAGADPLFDNVLDLGGAFSREFTLLAREGLAYERDLRRARHAIVFLPAPADPFATAYQRVRREILLDEKGAVRPVHLTTMAGGRRLPFDGLYLREPECLLFKEWARADVEGSSLHRGFTFLFIAYSQERATSELNTTNYFLSLDPENAGGAQLYTVWALLQAAEVAALRSRPDAQLILAARPAREGFGERAGALAGFFADPWYDAPNFACTLVATPARGTEIGPAGTLADCGDDPVARIVRAEAEGAVYLGPVAGRDIGAAGIDATAMPFEVDLSQGGSSTPVLPGHYRFASVELRPEVDLGIDTLAEQIAEALWRIVHPAQRTVGLPLLRHQLFMSGGVVGIWSRSGVAVAHVGPLRDEVRALADEFEAVVKCAREIDGLVAGLDGDARERDAGLLVVGSPDERERVRRRVAQGEQIMRRIAKTQHALALPEGRLIDEFLRETRLDELSTTLRDLSSAKKLDEQNERMGEHMETVAEVQTKLEWLELLFVGIYATEVASIFADLAICPPWRLFTIMTITIAITVTAAMFLKPWSRESGISGQWLLVAFGALLLAGLAIGAVMPFLSAPHC